MTTKPELIATAEPEATRVLLANPKPLQVRVVISDVNISFMQMVSLMVRASLAAALAAVITGILWIGMGAFAIGVLGFLSRNMLAPGGWR